MFSIVLKTLDKRKNKNDPPMRRFHTVRKEATSDLPQKRVSPQGRVISLSKDGEVDNERFNIYKKKFCEAFENDINTSLMITVVYDVLKDNDLNDITKFILIEDFDKVLSLDLTISDKIEISSEMEEEILSKIEDRKEAKKNKDFQLADKIRDELLSKGIKLIDTREGTTYELI